MIIENKKEEKYIFCEMHGTISDEHTMICNIGNRIIGKYCAYCFNAFLSSHLYNFIKSDDPYFLKFKEVEKCEESQELKQDF